MFIELTNYETGQKELVNTKWIEEIRNNTITVNMENLTQEERNQLISLVEKSNKPNPKKRWRAERDEGYYYMSNCLEIIYDVDNGFITDNKHYKMGNYFKTKEEAYFEREKLLVYQELQNYAIEHNESEIDWNNGEQYKYYIFYNNRGVGIGNEKTTMYLGQIYFTSREIAHNAIASIGEDRIEKYLFGVGCII